MVALFSKCFAAKEKKVKNKTYHYPSGKYSFYYAGSQYFPIILLYLQSFLSLQYNQSGEKIKNRFFADKMQNFQQNDRNRCEEKNLIAFSSSFLVLFKHCLLEIKCILLYILSKCTFIGRLLQELLSIN